MKTGSLSSAILVFAAALCVLSAACSAPASTTKDDSATSAKKKTSKDDDAAKKETTETALPKPKEAAPQAACKVDIEGGQDTSSCYSCCEAKSPEATALYEVEQRCWTDCGEDATDTCLEKCKASLEAACDKAGGGICEKLAECANGCVSGPGEDEPAEGPVPPPPAQ